MGAGEFGRLNSEDRLLHVVCRRNAVRRAPKAAWLGLWLAAMLVAPCGCRSKSNRRPVFPVHGKVLARGEPASGASVVFVPLGDLRDPKAQGKVGADGAFQLSTYALNDGAPAGRYGVVITWPGPNPRSQGEGDDELQGADRLGGRYSNPQASRWIIEVLDRPLELEAFNVE